MPLPVFEDKCVCLIRQGHPLGKRPLTMEGYLKWKHVGGGGMGVVQQILDRIGCKRDVQLRVPFSVLGPIIERTDMIATVPRRMAKRLAAMSKTQIVSAPKELQGFAYLQIWHPRYESEPVHKWLRELIKKVSV
jgi:DNA-binding transcriptional LysR family regulator